MESSNDLKGSAEAVSRDALNVAEPAEAAERLGRQRAASVASGIRGQRRLELFAVVLLGAGTLLAAWSGYQAAKWNGRESGEYVRAATLRVEATRAITTAGQERLYDSQVFSQWLNAFSAGNTDLATIYERRFSPEFRVAFDAWVETDPFNDPSAPPGPLFMPQYVQSSANEGNRLEAEAGEAITSGHEATDISERYVGNTVVFAIVLFLAAVSDRFHWRNARFAVLVIAAALLVFGLWGIAQLAVT